MRQRRRVWLTTGLSILAVGAAIPACAQVAPLPSRQEVTPPTPEPQQPSTAKVDARSAVPESTCPFDTSKLRLTVSKVEITRPDGSPLDPKIAATLAGLDLPQGDQPIGVVCTIRDEANARLRAAGWVASAQIPAQEITGGVLHLQVVTAKIVDVRIRGDAGRYEPLLRRRIAEIQALDPLNERDAERLLLLAGDTPGLDVALSLRPSGGEQGTVIGDLTVSSRRFAIFANAQNYNSKLLGRETVYARGEIYGLTGLSDITYLGASTTTDFQEQIIVQGGHIFTLDDNGTTFGGRMTYAWSRPDLGPLDLRTNTLIAGLDLTRPLIRSVRSNLRARLGFDYINQISRVGGGDHAVTLTTDRLRVLFAGVDADHRFVTNSGSTWLALAGSLDVRKGLGIFNASQRGFSSGELTSRLDGSATAWVVRGVVDATVYLGPIFSINGNAQAQWSDRPLLNYEEFALGSLTIGRGYDPGSNSGDRAAGGHIELRADLPLTKKFGVQLFGFYDYLHIANLDRTALEGPRDFGSAGGGVRFSLPNRLVLEATYAKPFDKALLLDQHKPPARFLLSLTMQLRDAAR